MSNVIFGNNGAHTLYGLPTNLTFMDVWRVAESETYDDECDKFIKQYKASKLYNANNKITDDNLVESLFYLLYAKYGNSSIATRDVNRFKYAVFTIIFQYGPAWEKKLSLQSNIRALTLTDLQKGGRAVYNHAYNPGTAPSTTTLDELTAINDQNTTNFEKSKIDAYTLQWDMIEKDVTEEFLSRFKPLFICVTSPLYQIGFEATEE